MSQGDRFLDSPNLKVKRYQMNIPDSCAKCIYDKQKAFTDNADYLADVKALLDNRGDSDTSPVLVYRIGKLRERYFGKSRDYTDVKRQYNDLALSMEDTVRKKILASPDPTAAALAYSRIGNYIDFGAMNNVSEDVFLALLGKPELTELDQPAYKAFLSECSRGKTFLLLADNCGEIVFDKLLIEQLQARFPQLRFYVMVRGGEVLNDATVEDAIYAGIDQVAVIVSNGDAVAGTVYEMMPREARETLDHVDVILSKGQGNYESLSVSGRHVFYSFLCKCDLFMNRFQVPKLTGMLVELGEVEDKNA